MGRSGHLRGTVETMETTVSMTARKTAARAERDRGDEHSEHYETDVKPAVMESLCRMKLNIFLETSFGRKLYRFCRRESWYSEISGRRDTELLVYYGKPGPFQVTQEIYVDFLPMETISRLSEYLENPSAGQENQRRRIIICGFRVEIVLNSSNWILSTQVAAETLTIPCNGPAKVITVGAYDSQVKCIC